MYMTYRLSEYWAIGSVGHGTNCSHSLHGHDSLMCRTNEKSDYWVIGSMGHRTNGSGCIFTLACRTNELSNYWIIGSMGCGTNGLYSMRFPIRRTYEL